MRCPFLSSSAQSRPRVVAMSTSFPAASASVHHDGANASRTIRPPAASAAAMRASACAALAEGVLDALERRVRHVPRRRLIAFLPDGVDPTGGSPRRPGTVVPAG
jgi:hypothetical protein